jgi:hypothetical protein
MNTAPISNDAPSWQKLTQIGLIILALTFVTEWAWTATSKHERVRALAANLVLSVAAVHALREPQKPNPFSRAPY